MVALFSFTGDKCYHDSMKRWLTHWLTPHKTNRHRPRLLHHDGLALLLMGVIAVHAILSTWLHLPLFPQILGSSSAFSSQDVLLSINTSRIEQGKPALEWNAQLAAAAEAKASDMLAKDYWAHTNPEGREPWDFIASAGYSYTVAGENLARNFSNVQSMTTAWLASPTHRANLLHDNYTQTGIAVVDGVMEGKQTTLVVQMFGKPKSAAPKIVGSIPENALTTTVEEEPTPVSTEVLEPPVLGAQLQLSPIHFYRLGMATLLTLLLGVLALDWRHEHTKRLKRAVGKNLAHIALLIAVIATVLLAEGGSLL